MQTGESKNVREFSSRGSIAFSSRCLLFSPIFHAFLFFSLEKVFLSSFVLAWNVTCRRSRTSHIGPHLNFFVYKFHFIFNWICFFSLSMVMNNLLLLLRKQCLFISVCLNDKQQVLRALIAASCGFINSNVSAITSTSMFKFKVLGNLRSDNWQWLEVNRVGNDETLIKPREMFAGLFKYKAHTQVSTTLKFIKS